MTYEDMVLAFFGVLIAIFGIFVYGCIICACICTLVDEYNKQKHSNEQYQYLNLQDFEQTPHSKEDGLEGGGVEDRGDQENNYDDYGRGIFGDMPIRY